MKCRKCDGDIVEQANFCSYCGERVAVACSSCGVLNPTDGLFCHDCGRSLTEREAPPSPDEHQLQSSGSGCPRCRTTNEPGSAYCYQCGLPLEEETRPGYGRADTHPRGTRRYESARIRANWTVGLLVATCVAYAIHMLGTFYVIDLVSRLEAGEYIPNSELDDAILALDALLILLFLVYAPTVVAFLMWTHRASRNLQPLAAHGQRFSPSWAVGWWFVPIMFYFRPYQVMAEIWRGSTPHMLRGTAIDWKNGRVTALLPWWWGLWVVSSLIGLVFGYSFGFSEAFSPDTVPSAAALQWDLLTSAITICAGVLAILVVRRITGHQDEKHRGMTAG